MSNSLFIKSIKILQFGHRVDRIHFAVDGLVVHLDESHVAQVVDMPHLHLRDVEARTLDEVGLQVFLFAVLGILDAVIMPKMAKRPKA